MSARRVVVKVGSSSLTSAAGHLDPEKVGHVVDALAAARRRGDEVVLVSSGAIAAGLGPLGLTTRPRDLPTQQAAASVGQGALVAHYSERFAAHGITVGQVLLTVEDVTRRSHYRNAHQTFARLHELGVLPVVNENDTVATSEIRFGDNDRLAALVAHLVHADLLVLLSDVDGLYTGHPSLPESRPITDVHGPDDLDDVDVARVGSKVGTGGMVTKVEAARIATGAGIPVVLARADHARAAVLGEPTGTRFHPTGRRRPTRLLWLEHASETKGRLLVDDGAVRALTVRKASLLAAGIVGVEGEFGAGEPVDVVAPDGTVVARGLVTYDSAELPTLLGRSTPDLAADLGADYEREVVHRDDLVVLHPH
ncbi:MULTISPECIES: glutamate 5-kinase [unclassified Aeromicrobium]|uniref:glutamate 5-kinase n=1 Tax=unclassified Aeromicrobium TaxID=2633570 RepID=UPI002096C9F9|nr:MULTISPECIES: glutamate 5-kinase [unclassified Aeromicrobium]MCO7238439.1 glutamate 5-kinase [Aeromicrobium sp. CnD17-E]MDR6118921.1 glutamate 5-kinase [Aeromicrobium sp. SORGH_AS_0981]